MKQLLTLSLIAAVVSPNLKAEEVAQEEPKELEVTAEAGVLITTGNTESSSYFGNLTVVQELTEWKNT